VPRARRGEQELREGASRAGVSRAAPPGESQLARTLDAEIPDALKGALDWEVD